MIEFSHKTVPAYTLVVVCVAFLVAFMAWPFLPPKAETGSNALSAAQVANTKAQLELQLAAMKNDQAVRNEVMNRCVEHGGIPVLGGGNIDCKVMK